MRTKKVCYSEIAYVAGILALAFGTAFMERADFGMSMVVAPAYILHLKISQYLPFYTFGMSEYVLQAVLLILLSLIMRKFRISYLFSFVTAVIYGFTLDFAMKIVGFIPYGGMAARAVYYVLGLIVCAIGVAFIFHTYISPEAYELFVKELCAKYGFSISKTKTIYDCCSCLIGVILSFAFFGLWHFEGVKWGTILCALVNGWLIGRIGALLERSFEFQDALRLRSVFEK